MKKLIHNVYAYLKKKIYNKVLKLLKIKIVQILYCMFMMIV